MANTQHININFAQGIDTKTDPWQLQPGKFLSLVNMVFSIGNMLKKRNGYGFLSSPPSGSYLTTFNENLLAIGSTINAYADATETWVSKGTLQPCSLSVMPLVRNSVNQVQVDSATASGLTCAVYTQSYATPTGAVTNYLYMIESADTGQNIVAPTAIPVLTNGTISGSSRIFVVGNYFVIVSPVTISATTFLQYVSIPFIHPTTISSAQNTFPEAYVALTSNPGWDGVVSKDNLVIAYNTTAGGGQGIHVTSLTAGQIAANQDSGVVLAFTNAAYKAGVMSVCVDTTGNTDVIYIVFWNPTNSNVYCCSVLIGFGSITTQLSPTIALSSVTVSNLASTAQNNSCLIYAEISNNYSFDSTVPSHYIEGVTVSSTGTVGTPYVVVRSVGLASKAFLVNGVSYFLSSFQSPFQPSFFLINGSHSTSTSPIIVAKLAYQNGGGYLALGLPSVSISDSIVKIAYLYKQDVEALNTLNNTQQTTAGGIYSQLGINLVTMDLGTTAIQTNELGKDLHLSGGFLSMFDGFYPVEHNYFIFPEPVKCSYTASSTVTPTGTFSSGATTITVSSASGISPGMTISDTTNPTYIPSGTTVVYVNGTTVTISQATTHSGAGDNLSIQGNIAAQPSGSVNTNAYYYSAVYQWTDMQGNEFKSQPSIPVSVTTSGSGTAGTVTISVPTLRLTQKVFNPVKIVIYRWSLSTQVYNQITSINSPVLNDTTVDSISFVDTLSDSNVIGNNLLYTTGGVLPDTNGPASNVLTSFDTRLILIDAEDDNVLWVSKTVVEGVPVEMSSALTIFVSPNIGTTQSTGGMKCIFPMDDKLIIWKSNSIFYINGTGPDSLGTTGVGCPLGNYSQPTFITSVVGCENQNSIVLTQAGLMFQSTDKGIWMVTRDLQTNYIGAPVEEFNGSVVTSAQVIPDTNFVLFTLDTGEMLMYDYYYTQWGIFKGAPAISSCIYQGLHTILTPYLQVLQETPGAYLDASDPVLMSFVTSWLNLATLQGYERFYEFYLLGKYLSPHKLNIQVAYDYNSSIYHLSTISPKNFSTSVPSPFGIPTPVGAPGNLEQWRIHTKKQLCQSFQIKCDEVFDPSYGTIPGAGFTMSGINCEVGIKRATRPIRGANAVG